MFAKKNCYLFCIIVTHVACSHAFLPCLSFYLRISPLGAAIKGATSFSSQENTCFGIPDRWTDRQTDRQTDTEREKLIRCGFPSLRSSRLIFIPTFLFILMVVFPQKPFTFLVEKVLEKWMSKFSSIHVR